MNCYLVIVSVNDTPVYTADFFKPEIAAKVDQQLNFRQLMLHSALDLVHLQQQAQPTYYLKVVDKINDWLVSAYVTPGGDRLLLLHDSRNDEAIRVFFLEVYELYLKVVLNPFYERGDLIALPAFDAKVGPLIPSLPLHSEPNMIVILLEIDDIDEPLKPEDSTGLGAITGEYSIFKRIR